MPPSLVQPVILSGGSGTRVWPLSRALLPKQFQAMTSDLTLLQETATRIADKMTFLPPVVVSNEEHRFAVAAQLEEIGVAPRAHLLEPAGRNTSAAVAVAAELVAETDPAAILLVLPADHLITEIENFVAGVTAAAELASKGSIVLFGIRADRPETGYGYIVKGSPLEDGDVFRVKTFIEKPNKQVAEALIAEQTAFWNSGIFVMSADTFLRELRTFQPEIANCCRDAVAKASRESDFLRVQSESFLLSPAVPIDKAVMEKSERLLVIPAQFGWSDIGSWAAVWDVTTKDTNGNATVGDTLLVNSRNCYVRGDKTLVAAVGVDDLIIVEDGDAVLVCSREQAQDVKMLVDVMKREGRRQQLNHLRVARPWGHFETIAAGRNFQVKTLFVKAGAAISLQFHRRRSEHWVIAQGTAEVTLDGAIHVLGPTQSIDVPQGTSHRLRNAGTEPLLVIEVQLGSYLGEDDIVRLDDVYRRPVVRGPE